jgi:hypothetical protein
MIHHRPFVLESGPRHVAHAMIAIGVVAASIGLVGDPQRTWPDLLLNGFYTIAIALAGVVFIALQYLCGAAWSAGIRRIPEAIMAPMPVAAVCMLSLFFGRHWLYGASHAGPAMSAAKAFYLATPFFFGRMAVFVAVWAAFAWVIRRVSLQQDRDSSSRHHQRLVRYSALFVVAFALSFSLASFDWLMTLVPGWSSTIFAVYTFAGLLVGGVAAITLTVVLLRERGYLTGVVNENHLHDLGKLLFAFSTFWAYIWVSQYLLIWYGNIPEEITYYVSRTGPNWITLFLLNVVVNWIIPFLVLLPRASKRNPAILKWTAILILAGRWLDLYLAIMPQLVPAPTLGVIDVLIVAGYAGLFFIVAARALARAPLVPIHDPYLRESLAHRQ